MSLGYPVWSIVLISIPWPSRHLTRHPPTWTTPRYQAWSIDSWTGPWNPPSAPQSRSYLVPSDFNPSHQQIQTSGPPLRPRAWYIMFGEEFNQPLSGNMADTTSSRKDVFAVQALDPPPPHLDNVKELGLIHRALTCTMSWYPRSED